MEEKKRRGSFNLIKKDVQLRNTIKVERDWYVLFNVLIICVIVCLSIISILFKLNVQNSIDNKSLTLAQTINSDLNTNSRNLLEARINVIEDKSAIYREFLDQNFDVNAFYEQVGAIYPGIKIDKFAVQPNSDFIDLDIRIESNAYANLPQFLNALSTNARFKNSILKNVNFVLRDELRNTTSTTQKKSLIDEKDNAKDFVTLISLSVEKKVNQE